MSTEPTEELLAQSAATCREGADEVNNRPCENLIAKKLKTTANDT